MPKRLFFLLLLLTLFPVGSAAQNEERSGAETLRVKRLSELARVWGTAKFFHPFLAYRADIDWDRTLVDAIPQVDQSRSPEEFAAALNTMLGALGDKSTRSSVIVNAEKPTAAEPSTSPITLDGDVIVIDAVAIGRTIAAERNRLGEFTLKTREMLARAKSVVIDLRLTNAGDADTAYFLDSYLMAVLPAMLERKITLSSSRYRMHNGYAPQVGGTSGGYFSGLVTEAPETLVGTASRSPRLVFLVNEREVLPQTIAGLQTSAAAFIIHDGASTGEAGAAVYHMALSDGVVVNVRTCELVNPDGTTGFSPDAIAMRGQALDVARRLIAENKFDSVRQTIVPTANTQISQLDRTYPEMEFPSTEYRLLALFRFWNVIDRFFPYKHLTDKPWADVLPKYIPKFEQDHDAGDYQMTVTEMVAELQDSHGNVRAPTLPSKASEKLGLFYPPLATKFVGTDLMVSRLMDKTAGLSVGDVIVGVDGETVLDYGKRFAPYIAHSTPQALRRNLQLSLLRGAKDSQIKLTLRDLGGKTREVTLKRTLAAIDPIWNLADEKAARGPVFQVLPSGYGYVDLVRLTVGDVDKMFETIMKAPATIFDMRGYPQGTAWSIAPRLTDKKEVAAALFTRPIWTAKGLNDGDFTGGTNFTFVQMLPDISGERYKGKVVMLIDENAISQSEHTALFFEAATDVTFVGTPTTGANGDVTRMTLPGNLTVGFSGHDVRHADGRQLQRVGIQPHITVRPTVNGVVAGKDEVLEAATKFLRSKGYKAK